MSTGFLDSLRQSRRPLIAVATALMVLQTVVVGIALAHSATPLEPFETPVICHGAGGAEPGSDPASDSHKALCCTVCIVTAPVMLPATSLPAGYVAQALNDELPAASHVLILIARRATRAGPSQAPPTRA